MLQQDYLLSLDALLAHLERISPDLLSESARRSLERLARGIPGDLLPVQVELFFYGALALHDQQRVDDTLAASASPHGLKKHEIFWTSLYPFLRQAGYSLRRRYAPGWRHQGPPQMEGGPSFRKHFPEAQPLDTLSFRAMPADCMRTGEKIVFKVLHTRRGHPNAEEINILRFFNEEPRRSHPHNVCVPVYDYIRVPNTESSTDPEISLAIMPSLRPSGLLGVCLIYGFALHVIKQSFEGVAFLHSLGIAHRDICPSNIMLSPNGPPFRVYFIDFGLASHFNPLSLPQRVTWTGGQTELPEVPYISALDRQPVDRSIRYDPFAADIYALYDAYLLKLTAPCFDDLGDRMTAADPANRPDADECVQLFKLACKQVTWRRLYRQTLTFTIVYRSDGWKAAAQNRVQTARAMCWYFLFGRTL
ncbi:kinase-like protein [Exidia glandulosa HHB12029]|uniref:Kinase-like protein n=1 Tax=Exidia glandulosa HHB12029 TaxID=1314781 RepID=A0A166B5H7_EXIGL|nr:kinase-like protein [Exidia glandulosa HHB12029]